MPDVLHWLGVGRIDRLVSMSNLKHDALIDAGIEIGERVPIPAELVPPDAQVEIRRRRCRILFAGTTEAGRPRSFDRAAARSILSAAFEPWSMRDETAAAFSLLSAEAVRSRAQRMLALGLDVGLPNFRVELARLDAAADLVIATMPRGLSDARSPLPFALAAFHH